MSRSMLDTYPDAQEVFLGEEDRSERIVAYIRLLVSFVFLSILVSIHEQIPFSSQVSLGVGTLASFLYSVFMFFYLRAGRYTPTLKYISIIFDLLLITIVIWSFGSYRTFKNEGFLIYYIWIAVSAMRFSPRLTMLAGIITVICYMGIISYATFFNTIEFGTLTESYTTHKVSNAALAMRMTFLSVCFLVLSYVASLNRRLVNSFVESESNFRGLVEKTLVGVYIFQDGKFIYVNPTFAAIFGYSQREIAGRIGIDGLVLDEDKRGLLRAMLSQLEGGPRKAFSCRGVHRYGHHINVETTCAWTEYNGRKAIIGTLSDISSRLKAQEAIIEKTREMVRLQEVAARSEALSKLKSDFLANMSHELRTPLNAVIGLGRVLRDNTYGQLNDKQLEYMDGIVLSGEHLLALINDILDLSKIEAGMEEPSKSVFNMAHTLRSSLVLVREKSLRHAIKLEEEVDPAIGMYYGDERRIKQILFNLISNAVKFTPDGGSVGLRAEIRENMLVISVWDTGIGIPVDKLSMIFEPFLQVDSSLDRRHEGTGLGLALTSKMVEMMDGTIEVESAPGRGSTFTVSFPVMDNSEFLERAEVREGVSASDTRLPEDLSFSGYKAMVVEDNPISIRLLSDFLKRKGFEVVEALDGESALEAAGQSPPDIILMDIQMPGMDGLEVARRLRAGESTGSIPLIAVTALAMPEDERRCLEAGFDAYFKKPVDLDDLLFRVKQLMKGGGHEV